MPAARCRSWVEPANWEHRQGGWIAHDGVTRAGGDCSPCSVSSRPAPWPSWRAPRGRRRRRRSSSASSTTPGPGSTTRSGATATRSGSTETIEIGSGNKFSPNPQNRGQPTSFLPGTNHNVFVVTWNGSGSLTWTLNGHDVSATKSSTACSSNPVPIAGGGPWYLLPGALVVVGVAGVGFCCRRFDLDLGFARSSRR